MHLSAQTGSADPLGHAQAWKHQAHWQQNKLSRSHDVPEALNISPWAIQMRLVQGHDLQGMHSKPAPWAE